MNKKTISFIISIIMLFQIMELVSVSASETLKFPAKFVFGNGPGQDGYTKVTNDMMYSDANGYGFVTEDVKKADPSLAISEIGDSFHVDSRFEGVKVTNILQEDRESGDNLKRSFCYSDKPDVPLVFKVKVPHDGNYTVKMVMGDYQADTTVTVFAQSRRYVLKDATAKAGEFIEHSFTANVSDVFVRDKNKMYKDTSIDIAVIGNKALINSLTIEEAPNTPTIYILGDSTLTDQAARYPFDPMNTYSGWAQHIPQFFNSNIAVSNHAHSGWNTNDPKNKGEWAYISKNIKKDDFLIIQFGHNDQKNPKLTAETGYTDNLNFYIDFAKSNGITPIIVSPLSRTMWKDGKFVDSLASYTQACKKVANEKEVPLVDLNGKSIEFILAMGNEGSKLFYVPPKDITHNNEFGAYEMSKVVYKEIKANVKKLAEFLVDVPHEKFDVVIPDPNTKPITTAESLKTDGVPETKTPMLKFKDTENHWARLDIEEMASAGIINGFDGAFMPENNVTRAEFLAMVSRALKIAPANVFNDLYTDVSGSEWYAGIIQSAYEKNLIDSALVEGGKFSPNSPITREQMTSMIMNAYKLTKNTFTATGNLDAFTDVADIAPWAVEYVKGAKELGIIRGLTETTFVPKKLSTRSQAAVIVKRLLYKLRGE